jgi:hypothetical protein
LANDHALALALETDCTLVLKLARGPNLVIDRDFDLPLLLGQARAPTTDIALAR